MKPLTGEWISKAEGDHRAWYFDGMATAGSWESILQRLRMGSAPADWMEQSERELDEPWIEFLASRGVTALMCFYSKGFGPETEAPVRENGRRLAELGHKHGMKAIAYLSDTVMLETFSLEEPDVLNWLQVNQDGEPVHYGGDQTHRRRGCFNNPHWRAYMKRMIKLARDDGFDGSQPDNDIWWPEPDSCRCAVCRDKFRQFLKERFPTPEASIERLGLPSLDAVEPPLYSVWFRPWDQDAIRNPMIQEWIWFRSESIADFRRELWDYVRTECPGMELFLPSSGVTARNMAWLHGEDHNRTTGIMPNTCTEEPLPCVYDPEADALGSKIRSMRLARRCGSIMMHNAYLAHEGPAKAEAMLGEGLAFNQGALGGVTAFHWGHHDWPDATDRYLQFLGEHRDLLTHVGSMAEVAVWHSAATFAFDGLRQRMCAILMEQALIQHDVIFDIILDRHLDELDRYKLLILPGSTCMTDEQAKAIVGWVESGGSVLATDGASSKDAWRRERPRPALAELFGWDGEAKGGRQFVQVFREFGKGRAAYIPNVEANLGDPQADNQFYKTYHWDRWRLPDNTAEILATVRALGYDQLATSFPRWVVCELTRLTRLPGIALHMLNYRKGVGVGSGSVSVRLPEGWAGAMVELFSPEWDGGRPLECAISDGRIQMLTPQFDSYCVAHISGADL